MKIEIKNLDINFGTNKKVIKNFTGDLVLNKLNVIIGKNGVGKSTLLDVISGLTEPNQGEIIGVPEQKEIMYVFQGIPFVSDISVKQFLKMYSSFGKQTTFEVKNILGADKFYQENIKPLLPSLLGTLSGGERRLVFDYASSLVLKSLYLFDEPLAGVDPENQIKIVDLLTKLGKEVPVIITSHDINVLKNFDVTVKYMSASRFVFSGSYQELVANSANNSGDAFINLTEEMRKE